MNINRPFYNGAQRRAQLLKKGDIMHVNTLRGLGDGETTSWGQDLLSLVKTALPIYQQQQVFDQQLQVAKAAGTPVVYNAAGAPVVASSSNTGKIVLLGAAALLTGVLIYSMTRRRR